MNVNEYFKTYYKIIMQQKQPQQNMPENNNQANIVTEQPNEINMQQKFQDAKNDALNGGVQNCTKEIAKAAYTEINEAYKDNPGLFDEIKSENKSDYGKNKPDNSSGTETTNTDSVTSQSIKLSNKFNEFYNLVFEDQLIEEGKTQQVYSDHYMLIVNDDGTFKLVNDEDPDTKFSLDDYKHVNNWIQSNEQSWMDCVKKFGGRSYGIKDEELDNLINNFKINDNLIDDKAKQRVKQVILNIKNTRHFKELSELYKEIKKKEGYLDKTKKTKIKTIFFKTLIFIIAKTYNDAPDKQERKNIAKPKEDQKKNNIAASKISLTNSNQKIIKLYTDFLNSFSDIIKDTDLEDSLKEGTGDADDEYFSYCKNGEKYSSWGTADNMNEFSNNFITFITSQNNNDTLQTKISAICYMKQTIQAKKKGDQYYGDDYEHKYTAINKFIDEIKLLCTKDENDIININANWDINFNLFDKNVLQQIINKGK